MFAGAIPAMSSPTPTAAIDVTVWLS